jgi:membrane fusion protein, copper/silver efflux system
MRMHYVLPALVMCLGAVNCSYENRLAKHPNDHGRRILYYRDPMHPSYRSNRPGIAPDCNMELTPVYAEDSVAMPAQGEIPAGIRVDDAQAAAIGLQTEAAREEVASGELRTVGRVETQESKRHYVTAGADGWIRHIHGGESGSLVVQGQPLASYYSRDVTSPQQAFLYALDAEQRLESTASTTQKDLAARQVVQARDYLEFLGLTAPQIADLARLRKEEREVTLGAPASGVVLERNVSEGTRFNRGDVLWEIGDIESVWIIADVFTEDLQSLSGACTATVILPGGSELHATVDSSLPRFEDAARVAKLRLTANNHDHRLLPGMTVTVVLPRGPVEGLTVPVDAVIESGIKPRVFVRRNGGSFEPRAVSTGWRSGGRQQILSGLRAGEEVVTGGAFLIDSESRLR